MDDSLASWLFEHGGPSIRYRLANEFKYKPASVSLKTLEQDLLNDATVRKWLDCLQSYEFMSEQRQRGMGLGEGGHSSFLHGSKNMNLEVVLPKLAMLGTHAGMPVLDEKTASWLKFLETKLREKYSLDYKDDGEFHFKVYSYHDGRMVTAFALAQAGYADYPPVKAFLDDRLGKIYATVKTGFYDILEPPYRANIRPLKWKNEVLKFSLYNTGEIRLPLLHDVFSFAAVHGKADKVTKNKIDTIVKWILAPEHQKLPGNYGYIRYPSGRGKQVSLRTDLPGYNGFSNPDFTPRALVLRCHEMGHFKPAREHPWFIKALKHLESFVTAGGTYIFPAEYLLENAVQGKWAEGWRMGLGENRRSKACREIESSFWMLAIKSLLTE